MTPFPGTPRPELESTEYEVESRAEDSLVAAYDRYPGRWSLRTFVAATKVPGLFVGMTPSDAEELLDRIEIVCRPANDVAGRDVAPVSER
jgi:hypothetical protein